MKASDPNKISTVKRITAPRIEPQVPVSVSQSFMKQNQEFSMKGRSKNSGDIVNVM